VIGKRVVLFGIEDLEQRRRRISPESVVSELVDFVEHEYGVGDADLLQSLDDVARQRADVCAPVPAQSGLVVDAAEGDSMELSLESASDAAAERGLAHPRRADQAQDGSLLVALELSHRQVLEDSFLHLLQTVVVGVQHGTDVGDIGGIRGARLPWDVEDPFDVRPHHRKLRRTALHGSEPLDLLGNHLRRLGRDLRFGSALFERIQVVVAVAVALPKLLFDGFLLLAKQVFSLGLGHLLLDLRADVVAHLEDLASSNHPREDGEYARLDVERRQELGFVGRRPFHPARDEIREGAGVVDRIDLSRKFRGHMQPVHDRPHGVPQSAEQLRELLVCGVHLSGIVDFDCRKWVVGHDRIDLGAGEAAQSDDGTRGPSRHRDHVCDRADGVEVLRSWSV
jgi:hypothetical protein